MQLNGTCPICDASVPANQGVEATEIILCPDCQSRLVVQGIANNQLTLEQAPEVEEDWGQ